MAIVAMMTVAACTSVQVQSLDSQSPLPLICIEKNPKVVGKDFLPVVRERIEFHGIKTRVFDRPDPELCPYILTYTAFKTWDVANYLHHAELRLEKNGLKVATAEYHLRGKGGLSFAKWKSTKSKMIPVIDEMLGK